LQMVSVCSDLLHIHCNPRVCYVLLGLLHHMLLLGSVPSLRLGMAVRWE
jgi:hypothetical protein